MADKPTDVKTVEEETTTAPSTEAKPEVKDPILETLQDEPEQKPEESETDKPEEPKEETPEKPKEEETKPRKADQRKEKLTKEIDKTKEELGIDPSTEIRDLVSARNALRDQVKKANEVYQPATEEELAADGMNPAEAKVEALRQELEVKDYSERVAEAQLTIESESQRVLREFPMFNPDSDQFDEDLSNEAAELLQSNLILDPNTQQVIGSNTSTYQLYKTLAKASGISASKGEMKGQAATEAQLANADSASSVETTKKTKDPILEALTSDDY